MNKQRMTVEDRNHDGRDTIRRPDGLTVDAHSGQPLSFEVTCVLGRVDLVGDGERGAHEAAFALVAQHDTPGDYTFPLGDGRTCRLSVAYVGDVL